MPTKQIKWGILGTSYISHVMASAIQESNLSQLRAINSRSLASAKEFAEKFALPTFYCNPHELLEDPDIDAVYIGLPNHLHKEWIIQCAKAGKHVLCEKPFVISPQEAQEVIAIVNDANVFCMEALMYRCHPLTQKLKELIESKIIGEIKLFNATYTANIAAFANPTAGGSIRNLGCYPISLIRLLANAEPVEIIASGRLNPMTKLDNQASVILKFADNVMAVVSTADDFEMYWQFDVYGTEGHLKVVSNPWLPERENNQIMIYLNEQKSPIEINVTAEKPLYTYQIDTLCHNVLNENFTNHNGISLQDSLGNITVLDNWLKQIL